MNTPAAASEPENLSLWGYFVRSLTRKYADFSGRARRKEFWGTFLFIIVIYIVMTIIGMGTAAKAFTADPDVLSYMQQNPTDFAFVYTVLGGSLALWIIVIIQLVLLVPILALLCRRYHDVGLSSTVFWVINWVPLVGALLEILVLLTSSGSLAGLTQLFSGLTMIVNLIGLIIGFIPGKKGPNAYGPDPKPEEVPTWDRQI